MDVSRFSHDVDDRVLGDGELTWMTWLLEGNRSLAGA